MDFSNWFDFIQKEGAAELENRRQMQLAEAEARAAATSRPVSETAPLMVGGGALPGWAIPAAIGVAALAVVLMVAR